jgi:uncharacterized protein (DUF305 family)
MNKSVLLILGFVLGIFTSSFVYLYISYQQKTSPLAGTPANNIMDHSQHMMNGMPSMNSMMKEYSDLEFLNLMIIHHQDALDMSQRALVSSTNQFIKNLSENIISSQTKEINEMKIEIDKIINQNK